MQNKYTIRLETKSDYKEAENLTREAFWNVYRPGCFEHYILHTFRDRADFIPELDFVMEQNGKLIGHVMYVRSEIQVDDGKTIPIMTSGPISIAPELKRQGYGTILLRYFMNEAKKLGAGALASPVTSTSTASPILWWQVPKASTTLPSRGMPKYRIS